MWLLIPIHVWIVADNDGVTLVDAGISPMAGGIMKAIEGLQAGPLKQIVLTHGHGDHVGAIPSILKSESVPVFVHPIEIPYMEGDLAYPRRKKAVPFVSKGVVRPLPVGDGEQLSPIAGLTPYWTPGHSPGHVAYYHEQDEVLLAGDLFTSKRGELRPPMKMFTAYMEECISSGKIIDTLKPKRLEICHGGSVLEPADQLEPFLRQMKKSYPSLT